MKKRLMSLLLVLCMGFALVGCSGGKEDSASDSGETAEQGVAETTEQSAAETGGENQQGKLVIYTHHVGVQAQILQELTDEWLEENPGVEAEVVAPGADYENVLKIKMASKDMPDIFGTHGWANVRYVDFLLPLNDEEWADSIEPTFKNLISDEEGNLLVLPVDQNKWGLVYNKDVLEKYGVEVPLTNVDDFIAALDKIKTESGGEVSPMHIAGGDSWPVGQIFDQLATPAFTTAAENDQEALLDGTFDWNKWTEFATLIKGMYDAGYFNEDIFTAKYTDSVEAFATGKAAFCWYGNSLVEEAKNINADVNAGLQPLPAYYEGDDMSFLNGEQTAFGIWKESENIELAKSWLAFMARGENIKKFCESENMLPGIETDVPVDLGFATKYYEEYKDIRSFPIFDRAFLPNGMWDLICKDAADMFTGAITPEQYSLDMKNEYERLREASE